LILVISNREIKIKEYFEGKIGRGNFFLRVVIYYLVLYVAVILMKGVYGWLGLILFFVGLALFFNAIGLRLNDLKKPWAYYLLIFVPIGNLYLLYLLFLKKGEKF